MPYHEERRQHRRYHLRLSARLLRQEGEVAAEVLNVSRGGCLLITPFRLQAGEPLSISIPELGQPPLALHVVRTRQVRAWYVAAARFEQLLPDESALARLARVDDAALPSPDSLL